MKNKKQLDCELNCKATARLELEIIKDLCQQDKCLASLLDNKEGNEDEESKTKDDTKYNN